MIKSIRTFLLINLLLSVTLVTSLAVISNLFLEHIRFQTHLDAQLSLAAYTIDAFLMRKPSAQKIKLMQQKIDHIPYRMSKIQYDLSHGKKRINMLLKSIQYQVFNQHNKLLLTSVAAPTFNQKTLAKTTGYYNIWQHGIPWRVFNLKQNSGRHIIVMQANSFRVSIEKQITKDSIMVMLVIYPFLFLLIWVVIGQGLDSIEKTCQALRYRSHPNRLKALKIDGTPKEIKPLLHEINNLFDRLKAAFLREKRFAGDAAHEMRTPLAGISMQAQVAKQTKDPKIRNKALNQLLTAVKHQTHVIQQLLTLSRMMPSTETASPNLINLNDLLKNNHKQMALFAKQNQITLCNHLTHKPLHIKGYETALLILLRNLTDNAIRYSPQGSAIAFTVKLHEHKVQLQILDQGIGIKKEEREQVFERFYRGDNQHIQGSGLGLGIVKQILDMHHAHISLHDNPNGQGLLINMLFKQATPPEQGNLNS
jgi:two-component system, OmpR family, sensor histidine kinase QseC